MSEWQDWRETTATQTLLRGWRRAGALDADGLQRAQTRFAGDPTAAQWRWFLDRLCLWLGVALCAAGTICFVAANWEHLGKFARLYGFQGVLVIAVVAAAWLGLSRRSGQAALWLATLVLGALLALIGQTYQTGADTWELFALWTALALPWTLAGRNAAQWLTWAVLLNLAFGLWLGVRGIETRFFEADNTLWQGLLNLLLLCGWEIAGRRWPEFGGRIGRWLLIAMTLFQFTLATIDEQMRTQNTEFVARSVWGIAIAALVFWYWRRHRDLPALAMCALSVIFVATAQLARTLFGDGGWGTSSHYLLIAVAVIVQAALAAMWLRRLAKEGAP